MLIHVSNTYFGFTSYWSNTTYFLGSQCVYDWTLAHIGVSYKPYTVTHYYYNCNSTYTLCYGVPDLAFLFVQLLMTQWITSLATVVRLTLANCLSNCISAPLPKECNVLAWKANVGYSSDSMVTHWVCKCNEVNMHSVVDIERQLFVTVAHVGTRSHLFRRNSKCLCGFSFFRNCSICFDLVPRGSRASNTYNDWIQ